MRLTTFARTLAIAAACALVAGTAQAQFIGNRIGGGLMILPSTNPWASQPMVFMPGFMGNGPSFYQPYQPYPPVPYGYYGPYASPYAPAAYIPGAGPAVPYAAPEPVVPTTPQPVTAPPQSITVTAPAPAVVTRPRAPESIDASFDRNNRLVVSWQGDQHDVATITVALLDSAHNPISQRMITGAPAQGAFTVTNKTAYYRVIVRYMDGSSHTFTAPL